MELFFYIACICSFFAIFRTLDIESVFWFCISVILFSITVYNSSYALSIPFLLLYTSECLLFLLMLANNKQSKVKFNKMHFFATIICCLMLYFCFNDNISKINIMQKQNIDVFLGISCIVVIFLTFLVLACISSIMIKKTDERT